MALERGSGLSYQTVYHLLRKPWRVKRLDMETLTALCRFLDCQPGDLLTYDPDELPSTRLAPTVNPLRGDWPEQFLRRLRDATPIALRGNRGQAAAPGREAEMLIWDELDEP